MKRERLIAKMRKIMDGMGFNSEWYENPQNVSWIDELDCRWISRCKRAGTLILGYDKRNIRSDIDRVLYAPTKVCEYCHLPEHECACDECRFCDWCDKAHHSLEKRSYCKCSELEYIADEIAILLKKEDNWDICKIEALEESK